MVRVKDQSVEDEYQSLVARCTRHQFDGTCDKKCSQCHIKDQMNEKREAMNQNVRAIFD